MGNAADVRDAMMEQKERDRAAAAAQKAAEANAAASAPAAVDPYGTSGISNQSVRRRGDSTQQRVGTDTRVRDDASSGTAGAAGGSIGAAMSQAAAPAVPEQPQNAMWQAARQPTDLASIQQRVLQSLAKPYTPRGQ